MWGLLKDYLENNEIYPYENVELITFEEDSYKCKVRFKYANKSKENETVLNLWDVLAYVYSRK